MTETKGHFLHGMLLMVLMSLSAFYIAQFDFIKALSLSPLIVGIILGMVYANTLRAYMPPQWEKSVKYCHLEPQAPVHVLVIPKKHITGLDDVKEEDKELMGHIMFKIHEIAADLGLENGYRVVSNNGEDAFQTVKHLHFHILGKRKMTWPPG